jgi:glucosamine--fructose-6-phosphate aminotransferase (isomerizing)
MCGIVAYTGDQPAKEILIEGLKRLEYRGYDSSGIFIVNGSPYLARAVGKVAELERQVWNSAPEGVAGIAHTRWATHGKPSVANAHPHADCGGKLYLVHNGIIENHLELSDELVLAGHHLESDTDTEVLAHLIESELGTHPETGLVGAVRETLQRVRGYFAIAVIHSGEPDLIVAARRVSPLVMGLTETEALLASDIPALLGHTRSFLLLEDDQIAELRPGSIRVTTLDGTEIFPPLRTVDYDLDAARKDGYPDYMSKEMHEQPMAVANTLLDRLLPDGTLALDEVRISDDELRSIDKVFIVACGSSYHAGLMAKYAIEHWARLPVEIDISSEFRYRDPVLDSRTLVIGVSQSGETVDTLQALREARKWNAKVLVISNVVDSSMTREADAVLYTRAGPELGVASTKTHLAQITALEILALYLAQTRGTLYPHEAREFLDAMGALPDKVETALGRAADVEVVATAYRDSPSFIFLGRHVGYPVALEGALKLKELSYLWAEGFPAGELKHGPIAVVEPGTVVIGVATRTHLWEKMMANVAEVKSRGATVVLVANDGDEETERQADAVLWVPETHQLFTPIVDVVPLQLFAYSMARLHGLDVDRPRNLAKVVTVE